MVGYDAKNKNILDIKFICPICSLIVRDPIQLMHCGHRRCQSCVDTQHGVIMKCLECRTKISSNQIMIDRGFENDMKDLPIVCSFCNWADILKNYPDHLNNFHSNPKCEDCSEQYNSIDKFFEHKAAQYQEMTIECLLKNFGCIQHIFRRDISDHYLSEQHQDLLSKVIRQMNLQLENTTTSLFDISTNLSSSTTVTVVDPDTDHFRELVKTIANLMDIAQMLNEDGTHLNIGLLDFQRNFPTVKPDFFQVKLAVQENAHVSNELTSNQDSIRHGSTSLKDNIDAIERLSPDGIFVWKITNAKEKMMDAQSGRQISIDSPPFYTSRTGYKMCVRLYFNGDRNAQGTHISLFAVLMQGNNDIFLRFPFNFKMAFCMHNQTSAQQHIIDSFRPDIRSNSFEQPKSNMNIASGIPKFFPLAMIQQEETPYIRDDTMFIKVMVDLNDTPQALLPYILSLNLGISPDARQTMIQQEIERRTRQ